MDFGLLEPTDDTAELVRERQHWDRHNCHRFADAHLPLLMPDKQLPIYEEVLRCIKA